MSALLLRLLLLTASVACVQLSKVPGDCSVPTITKFRINWTQRSNKVTVMWTPEVLNGSYEVSNASDVAKVRPWCKRLRYEVRSWEWKEPQNIPDNIQNVTTAVFDEWSQRSKRYYLRRRHLRKSWTAKFAVLTEKFYTFSVVIGHTKTFEEQPVAIQASRLLFTGAQDPVRIIPPKNGTRFFVPHGQSFKIKCQTTGIPPPQAQWARVLDDPFAFHPTPRPNLAPEELDLPTVQPGTFQCIASNTIINRDYSRSEYTATMTITIIVYW